MSYYEIWNIVKSDLPLRDAPPLLSHGELLATGEFVLQSVKLPPAA
jgi:hypothetical protein